MKKICKKDGQIWIETVIYTLIGLTIIGLVLAAALPKINQKKDSITIEQSIQALGNINNKIYDVQRSVGNRRIIDLNIKKGYLIINMENNTISWILDSSFPYSETDTPVPLGALNVTTTKGNPWKINLKLKYNIDLRYNGINIGTKEIDPAPTPYKLIIEYHGNNNDSNIIIDLSAI